MYIKKKIPNIRSYFPAEKNFALLSTENSKIAVEVFCMSRYLLFIYLTYEKNCGIKKNCGNKIPNLCNTISFYYEIYGITSICVIVATIVQFYFFK